VALVWLWSTIRQSQVSRKFGIVLALLFLFLAFFNAWREQYKLTHPSLLLEFQQNGVGYSPVDPDARVFIQAVLYNRGAPTICHDWTLLVAPPHETGVQAESLFVGADSPITFQADNGTWKFDPQDTLYYKTTNNPIASGAQVAGTLVFRVPGVPKPKVAQRGTKLRLTCKSVFGEEVSAEVQRRNIPEGIKFYPGVQPPVKQQVP